MTYTVVLNELPRNLQQLQAMPEAALKDPFQTAALTVCALCVYSGYPHIGAEMLNWLRDPRRLPSPVISLCTAM